MMSRVAGDQMMGSPVLVTGRHSLLTTTTIHYRHVTAANHLILEIMEPTRTYTGHRQTEPRSARPIEVTNLSSLKTGL